MSFPHNNFLTGATSDADIAVVEILDTYFKKDETLQKMPKEEFIRKINNDKKF